MQVSQALVAFAFVSEAFKETGDIVNGLIELFGPLLAEHKGERFDPQIFVRRVKDTLDIEMHPYVADSLAPRLEQRGYLTETVNTGKFVEYVVSDIVVQEQAISESEVLELLERFDRFAIRGGYGREELIDGTFLHDEFLNRLIRPEFLNLILDPVNPTTRNRPTLGLGKSETGSQSPTPLAARIDVLVASFILELNEKDPGMFDVVANISGGALLAEVVSNTQTPTNAKPGLSNMVVYVDGPLVMDALGLNSVKHAQEYASLLLRQLHKAGAKLFLFSHTFDEIRNAIKAPLQRYTNREQVDGPLGALFQRDSDMVSYCRGLLGSLRLEVENVGVRVFQEFAPTDKQINAFTQKNEEELVSRLGYWNVEARQRDAKSVANVLRLRGSRVCTGLSNCGFLFVTRNSLVAHKSRDFLNRYGLAQADYFPPAVTDRHLAGLVWIAFGGGGGDLSRLKLIANCSATMRPREDVIANMYQFLSRVDEEKVDKFKAIMTDERAGHYLMDLTLGDATLVREDNVVALYDSIRQATASEMAIAHERKLSEMNRSHGEELAAEIRDRMETESRLEQSKSENAHLRQAKVDAEQFERERHEFQLNSCVEKGGKRIRVFEVAIASTIAVAAAGASLFAGSGVWSIVAALLSFSVCVGNYLLFPGKWLHRWIRAKGENTAKAEAQGLGLSFEGYSIDWTDRSVSRSGGT